MFIKCKPYGYSAEMVYIVKDKITDWYAIDYNGRLGTCVRTVDGKEILVGNIPKM